MSVEVPLLDLVGQYEAIRGELDAAVARVAASQRFIMGPEVEALEREIADYCGAGEGVGCASGSEALLLVYMALGVGPGDAVVCPSFTFFSTAGSVARLGARPVFADIDPVTYNVTAETVARALEGQPRVKAIVPVHLFGQALELAELEAVAGEIPLVEDAAQAIGSVDGTGRRVGQGAHPVCLSFFPSKNLGAWGDGGMILASDPDLVKRLQILRVHGGEPKYYHEVLGLNGRLDAIQAAVLRAKLPHLESWHAGRVANAAFYDASFKSAGAAASDVPLDQGGLPLRTPLAPKPPARHIYNQYVIRVPEDRRDALRAHLTEQRIGTEIYYPVPLHLQGCFAGLGGRPGDLPHAEAAARETLALPIYPELTQPQLEHVVEAVVGFLS